MKFGEREHDFIKQDITRIINTTGFNPQDTSIPCEEGYSLGRHIEWSERQASLCCRVEGLANRRSQKPLARNSLG
jgi:hypothetical protein